MADTTDSKSVARKGVRVQVPPRAPVTVQRSGWPKQEFLLYRREGDCGPGTSALASQHPSDPGGTVWSPGNGTAAPLTTGGNTCEADGYWGPRSPYRFLESRCWARGQAWAVGPKGKVTCSTVTGTVTGHRHRQRMCRRRRCQHRRSFPAAPDRRHWLPAEPSPGSAGRPPPSPHPHSSPTSAKKCPGYVKPAKGQPPPPTNPTADKFAGTVTADTSGMKVPGKFKGAVCISSTGNITALKALKVN